MSDSSSKPPSGVMKAVADASDFQKKLLFWGCFISLVATSFGFVVRAFIIGDWGTEFGLTSTQQGEIFGVGLWPFAISIVLFSLIIDRIGYGKAMAFAFICHVASVFVTISAGGYWGLYVGTLILALGNGTVEAVINPVVATMFPKEKAKWLTILHAGWPAGLVLGGVLAIFVGDIAWQWKVGLVLIPVIIYGVILLRCVIPQNERVAAGVSFKEMLQEAGILGAIVVVGLIVREVGRVFDWSMAFQIVLAVVLIGGYGAYVRTLGRPLFFFLLLIMIPLAITELGTDSWITDLMGPAMGAIGLHAGWVLVYTSLIMMILRFYAGPVITAFTPLGLLAICSLVAVGGLIFLSQANAAIAILLAATVYGFGKTYFWPAMLGVVAEQFPKGGALTLNSIAGVGMIGVGVIGAPLLGNLQDRQVSRILQEEEPAIYMQYVGDEAMSVFGTYTAITSAWQTEASPEERAIIEGLELDAKQTALINVAVFPMIMFVCYIILILYFRSKGGYKAEMLTSHTPEGKRDKYAGGVAAPVE